MKITIFKIGGSVLNSSGGMSAVNGIKKVIIGLKKKIIPGSTIIVHGGGDVINHWLKLLNIEFHFVEGQRVTDSKTIAVVEMVLSGLINKEITCSMLAEGFIAAGISGRDMNIASARFLDKKLGYVGEVDKIRTEFLLKLLKEKIVPVISPLCQSNNGHALNVNADFFAAALASALKAKELNMITSTGGVLKDNKIISKIIATDINLLIKNKTVSKGMIPKLLSAEKALKGGVKKVNLLNYEGKTGTIIRK